MDALGDILRVIRLQGSVYFNACFCSSWGLSMERSNQSMFHIIVKGDAWLQMESLEEPMHLQAGDIVFFPKGAAHTIAEQKNADCMSGKQVVEAYSRGETLFDGDQEEFNIVCGYVKYTHYITHPFIENLPQLIHINTEMRTKFVWLDAVIQQIVIESRENCPGSLALIDKFTEILFMQIIRVYAEEMNTQQSYLSALMDKRLSHALALIHSESEKDWTIEQLALEVGMSRSSLYSQFNDTIGVPPMKYLYEWRMLEAKQKIENSNKAIALIAEEVGYQSDSAFQKAFKRFFNFTPASLRKR